MKIKTNLIIKILLISPILVLFGLFYLIVNWNDLPFSYQGYDRNFNKERIEIGQPIIEDYFITEMKGRQPRKFWFTPDSLKTKKIHWSKFYSTEKGDIIYEEDFFVYKVDSVIMVLERSYYYKQKKLYYSLVNEIGDKEIDRDSISTLEGDSILLSWQTEYPEKK